MRAIVRDKFTAFTVAFEGATRWMYLDVKGLVTTGDGNLIDSVAAAQALPWRHGIGGDYATPAEVAAAWNRVKASQDKKLIGGGNAYWQNLTDLRLDDDGIRQLVQSKLESNEAILKKRFPNYELWPADAQLGLLSMAWAMGPNFNYPKFQSAVNQLVPDFAEAARQSHMSDAGNPGLVPRNAANLALFNAAADTLRNNLDVDDINWDGFSDLLARGTKALSAVAQQGVATVKKKSGSILAWFGFTAVASAATYAVAKRYVK